MNMHDYGWNEQWELRWSEQNRQGHQPGRIAADFGQKYKVITEAGEMWGEMSGRLRHQLTDKSLYPAVGDWVEVQPLEGEERVVIHHVLERLTSISRQSAGVAYVDEQIIAANVDTLFLVSSLNDDFNPRRMERYLIMAWNSGVTPVILLSKADLCDNPELKVAEMEGMAPGVQVHAVSAVADIGKEVVNEYLRRGATVALTGSSGCGKSTMVNWLSGSELQLTQGIREDDSRGRHTTTHREMFLLPQGGVMVDTPGMRELKLYEDEGGWAMAFADIEEIGKRCRFVDCKHENEAGCAVIEALRDGTLDGKRLQNYRKTERELQFQARKEARSRAKMNGKNTKAKPVRSKNWIRMTEDE